MARRARRRKAWIDSRTSASLRSRRRASHCSGLEWKIARSNRTPANTRFTRKANPAARTRLRSSGSTSADAPYPLMNPSLSRSAPVTPTARRLPQRISRILERRMFSRYMRSSTSLLALTPCIMNSVTASERAAIAPCAVSKAPRITPTSPGSGRHVTGGVTIGATTRAALTTSRGSRTGVRDEPCTTRDSTVPTFDDHEGGVPNTLRRPPS